MGVVLRVTQTAQNGFTHGGIADAGAFVAGKVVTFYAVAAMGACNVEHFCILRPSRPLRLIR